LPCCYIREMERGKEEKNSQFWQEGRGFEKEKKTLLKREREKRQWRERESKFSRERRERDA